MCYVWTDAADMESNCPGDSSEVHWHDMTAAWWRVSDIWWPWSVPSISQAVAAVQVRWIIWGLRSEWLTLRYWCLSCAVQRPQLAMEMTVQFHCGPTFIYADCQCTGVNPAVDAGDTSPIFWLGDVNGNIPSKYYQYVPLDIADQYQSSSPKRPNDSI